LPPLAPRSTRGPAISRSGLAAAALPAIAIGLFVLTVGATLAVAGDTLGYDYLAYDAAARRLIAGQPLYDTSFAAAGSFGLFYYPPPFVLLVLPFAVLPSTAATWAWIGVLVLAFLAGVAVLPVSRTVRWLVVLAAAIQWPFVYALKLGQVGPLLFLCFAIGWRWLDQPVRLGSSAAAGALIKVQPGILVAWAALTGRWRAAIVSIVVMAAVAVVTTLLTGLGAWFDFLDLVRRVSDPITTDKNFTPGAVAYQLGADRPLAVAIQVASTAAVAVAVVVSARSAPADASFLLAVVASQLVSPILWDHYLMLALLPMAWLLERRHLWAWLIPALTSIPLLGITPAIGYLAALVVALLGPWAVSVMAPRNPVVAADVGQPTPVGRD
jgi:glycosyl transferase family 87